MRRRLRASCGEPVDQVAGIAPSGRTPVPPVASRMRSSVRRAIDLPGTRRKRRRPGRRRARAPRCALVVVARRFGRLPLATLSIRPMALRSAPCWPIRLTELHAPADRADSARRDRRACAAIWSAQRFGHGEMLEQRNDIGEGFVEGERRRGWSASPKQRCRPSSSACVVSWATMSCERQLKTSSPGKLSPPCPAAREIAEQQRLLVGAVVGVGFAQARADRCAGAARIALRRLRRPHSWRCAAPKARRGPAPARNGRWSSWRRRKPSAGETADPLRKARAPPLRARRDDRDRRERNSSRWPDRHRSPRDTRRPGQAAVAPNRPRSVVWLMWKNSGL